MRLDIIGSAGSYPSPNSACSSYLVSSSDSSVLLDAGNGSLSRLFRTFEPSKLAAIVISHSHLDHFADLVGIYHYLKFARSPEKPIPLYGTPEFEEKFLYLVGSEANGDGIFVFRPSERGSSAAIGSLRLSFFEGNHSVPTLIVRVSDGESSICYGADGDISEDLASAAVRVDLLLGEATWVKKTAAHPVGLHLDARELAQVAQSCGAARLVATHLAYPGDRARTLEILRSNFSGKSDLAEDGSSFVF